MCRVSGDHPTKPEYGDGMVDRGRVPALLPGLSGVGRWARVAAAGCVAGLAWLRGDAAGCQVALDRQRGLVRGHPASEVSALTTSALLTAASGDPGSARRELEEAESRLHAVGIAALAPQWEQATLVCDWAAGERDAAQVRTVRLEELPPPVPAAVTLSLRVEVLRKSGRLDAARRVAGRLGAASPAALGAWALAGLDHEPAAAPARLRTATAVAWRDGHQGLLPLSLHRTAKIAFDADEPETVAEAHAGFARLAQDDPLTRVLAGLTEARATRSAGAARRAQELADCREVRERLGDDLGRAASPGRRGSGTICTGSPPVPVCGPAASRVCAVCQAAFIARSAVVPVVAADPRVVAVVAPPRVIPVVAPARVVAVAVARVPARVVVAPARVLAVVMVPAVVVVPAVVMVPAMLMVPAVVVVPAGAPMVVVVVVRSVGGVLHGCGRVCRLRGSRQGSDDDRRADEQARDGGSSRFHGSPRSGVCTDALLFTRARRNGKPNGSSIKGPDKSPQYSPRCRRRHPFPCASGRRLPHRPAGIPSVAQSDARMVGNRVPPGHLVRVRRRNGRSGRIAAFGAARRPVPAGDP
jgi:hypothetical protein